MTKENLKAAKEYLDKIEQAGYTSCEAMGVRVMLRYTIERSLDKYAAKRGTERLADGYLSRDEILQTYLEKC